MRQRQPDPPQSSGGWNRPGSCRALSRPEEAGARRDVLVIVMTIAALVGVAVLAAQAAATAPKVSNGAGQNSGKVSPQPTGSTSTGSSAGGAAGSTALPANSGQRRARRLWRGRQAGVAGVVGQRGRPHLHDRAGTVPAPAGSYNVTNKLSSVMGTDETPVQYVVLFGKVSVNGSSTASASTRSPTSRHAARAHRPHRRRPDGPGRRAGAVELLERGHPSRRHGLMSGEPDIAPAFLRLCASTRSGPRGRRRTP